MDISSSFSFKTSSYLFFFVTSLVPWIFILGGHELHISILCWWFNKSMPLTISPSIEEDYANFWSKCRSKANSIFWVRGLQTWNSFFALFHRRIKLWPLRSSDSQQGLQVYWSFTQKHKIPFSVLHKTSIIGSKQMNNSRSYEEAWIVLCEHWRKQCQQGHPFHRFLKIRSPPEDWSLFYWTLPKILACSGVHFSKP